MASENLVQETEGEFRNGKAVFVKGVRMPHVFAYLTGFKDFIENFQTRRDDVFIVGFPRSGTTWLQEITWEIFSDGAISTKPIGHRVQFFDEAKFPHTTQPDITTQPSPRLMKTHQPFHAIPKGTSDASRSYWGSWAEHVVGWWNHKDDSNVLFLKYEDLKKDLPSQVRLIAKFLGKSLTEETMERIAKQCAFDEMKKNASAYWMMTRDNECPNFLRCGVVGDWKNYFTPELNARFESEVLSKLEGTGLQFDFDQ